MKWVVYVITGPTDPFAEWFHVHPLHNVERSEHLQQQRTVYRTMEVETDTYWEAQRMARQVIDVERRLEAAIA